MYQDDDHGAAVALIRHVHGDQVGYMATLTGRQARLDDPDARPNELSCLRQVSWSYPNRLDAIAAYLVKEATRGRDAYYSVHLFREAGNRIRTNSCGLVTCLWLDEDEGRYPCDGPQPTAIVRSSATRRHLYWQLDQPVAIKFAVELNKRIAHWSNGDAGKAGLSSVLRPPGTANYKRHPSVDPVTLELPDVAPYSPGVLDAAVPPLSTPRRREPEHKVYNGPRIDLLDFLESSSIEVRGYVADSSSTKFAIVCPWAHEHSGGDRSGTFVGQYDTGHKWFSCRHDHCSGRAWRDFRRHVSRPIRAVDYMKVSMSYDG